VKIKKSLTKRTYREKVIASGGKDPMRCSCCDNFYELRQNDSLSAGTARASPNALPFVWRDFQLVLFCDDLDDLVSALATGRGRP
ncbi:hypothetical protein ACFSW4_02710, partial [Piscibacillus salipiscarius]